MTDSKLKLQLAVIAALACGSALAQDTQDDQAQSPQVPEAVAASEGTSEEPIDEIVTLGRLLDAGQALVIERMDDAAVTDILGADAISRLGDSNVAVALKRVPGLSVVNNKFVYIRGLGERYSQSTLNGARIPSPDLTRNVIPLNIFPVSIVESLKVQKAYTADMRANFAGGSVDIRTVGIPDAFVLTLDLGTGFNTEVDGNVFTYAGGSDDDFGTDDGSRQLSGTLLEQVNRFQGNVDTQGILSILQREDPTATLADAQLINRQLGLELNRAVNLEEKDPLPDIDFKASVGNNFVLNEDWEVGFLVGGSYGTDWREETSRSTNFVFPTERTDTELESTRTVNISGIANFGVNFTDEHSLTTSTLYLRNTDDETGIRDFFNENREVSDGIGFRNYRFLFEERDMVVNQLNGTHILGEQTRSRLGALGNLVSFLPEQTEITWFYSDADARTDIPNQVDIAGQTVTDPITGQVLSSAVNLDATAARYRFTDLDDEVESSGIKFKIPFETDSSIIDLSFGFEADQKARTYRQYEFSIGALSVADTDTLSGPLSSVFSDANILNPDNNFVFDRRGTNNQSYLAATMTDAAFGMIDWTYNDTWRIAAGLRWEDYRQVALDWNPLGFSETDPQVSTDPDDLERSAFQQDDIFPSLAVTYMSDWLAETFQLRFGYSETAIRPDLREITDASYIDPITNDLVDGNPGVVPAAITNFDVRAEWFLSDGDNYTVSFFYKDIDDPIEFFESAASDTTVAREIINAESAEVYGIELEGLKRLGFLGSAFDGFFLQGNLTLQDSELVAGEQADAPTNPVRKLTSASDYVANVTLGFDSENGRHAATLVYNVFGERLYVSGRNGAPDGFEQPFHGIDMTYSWFPTDRLTVKAKAQNVLGETITIEREGVVTFEQDPGSTFAVAVQWAY
ncbi:MAG: TonB-dependent receptor [Pseudomonadota bacterium]